MTIIGVVLVIFGVIIAYAYYPPSVPGNLPSTIFYLIIGVFIAAVGLAVIYFDNCGANTGS